MLVDYLIEYFLGDHCKLHPKRCVRSRPPSVPTAAEHAAVFRHDTILTFFFIFVFPILRYTLDHFVFHSAALYFCVPLEHIKLKTLPQKYANLVSKFKESMWKACLYGSFTLLAVYVVYDRPYLFDTDSFWRNCLQMPCLAHMDTKERILYRIETGYYIFAMAQLVWWETKRKDFKVLMIHHVVTFTLLAYSYVKNMLRVGTMIMLLHDVCDVPMEMAKLFRYANTPGPNKPHSRVLDRLSEMCFIGFVVAWILTRLIYFPIVIRSVMFGSYIVLKEEGGRSLDPHKTLFAGLLISLFFMHVYWTGLIFRVVSRFLSTGKREDVREDEDDD